MADIIKLSKQEAETMTNKMKQEAERAREYINKTIQSDVDAMGQWWVGNAYNKFKEDFQKTRDEFGKKIADEIIAYANDLNKVVAAQHQTDIENEKVVVVK